MKKIFFPAVLFLILAVGIVGLTGCKKNGARGASSRIKESSHKSDQKIIMMVRTGQDEEVLKKLIQIYEETTGVTIETKEISRDSYFTVMPTQLLAGSSDLDIALIPNTYMGMLAGANALEPLDEYLYKDKIFSEDFFALYGYQGNVYLIPTDIITHFLYYRKDLIAKPPDTWDEFLEMAKKYTVAFNPNSPTKWGASFSSAVEELPKEFNCLLWSFNGDVVDENNNIYINNPSSVKAGEFLRKLVNNKVMSPQILSWSDDDVVANLVNGNTAMAAPLSNTLYYEIKKSSGRYKDQIGIALIPGMRVEKNRVERTPLRYSWTFGINANSLHKQTAWNFISWFMSKAGKNAYVAAGGTPPRLSVLMDPIMQASHPEFKLLLNSLNIGRTEPSITYYPGLLEVESEAITKIMSGNAQPKEAFQNVANKIKEFVQNKN